MKRTSLLVLILVLLLTSCSPAEPTTTPTEAVSPTSLPSETPRPTFTSNPPTQTPKLILAEGTLTIKVNVRNGPGTEYESLGQLNGGEKVQIASKNKAGTWYQILYAPASSGRGWVTAQYVQVKTGVEIPLEATATPAGPTGVVLQRLNVRSGPGTTFDTLGTVEAKTVLFLTGKNGTASWFQIDYAAGPGGRGWVTAQYIQTEASASLQVLDDYGTPVAATGAGTPAGPVASLTPTIGMAYQDGDSREAPAARIVFSATGTDRFTYSSQVSAPEGDGEDWVEFTPFATSGTEARLLMSLSCSGNDSLQVELWQKGSRLSGRGSLNCGEFEKAIFLTAGQPYEIRLAPASGEGLRLVDYVLTVENR
jgi:uncharacterized protein YgiM (DUF1202 family)